MTDIMSQSQDQQIDQSEMQQSDEDLISQLDALDDQSLCDPSAYFHLLALMEPRLHAIQSINQLKESVSNDILSKDSTSTIDLNQSINQSIMIESISKERSKVLEQLSRSKMNFLHVQTKRLLIESLLPLSAAAPIKTDIEVRLAEQAINDAKANLESSRRQLDEVTKEIKTKAHQFTVDYDQLINQSNAFQDEFDPDRFALLTEQMIECGLDPNAPSSYDDQVIADLLAHEQSTIDELEAQIKAVDDEIEAQTNDIASDENTMLQIQKQMEADPPLTQTINPAELEWYHGIIDVLSQWNGISIVSAQSERSLKIQISPISHANSQSASSSDLIIEVDVNPTDVLQFNGGVITSGHVSDATWDRILDEALETQNLPGMLRALQVAITEEQKQSAAQPMEQ